MNAQSPYLSNNFHLFFLCSLSFNGAVSLALVLIAGTIIDRKLISPNYLLPMLSHRHTTNKSGKKKKEGKNRVKWIDKPNRILCSHAQSKRKNSGKDRKPETYMHCDDQITLKPMFIFLFIHHSLTYLSNWINASAA